jgi:purine-binding chemotaxis protein CheW
MASALQETPKVGLRWRPEFISCIGKRGEDFIVVLDIKEILSMGPNRDSSVPLDQKAA